MISLGLAFKAYKHKLADTAAFKYFYGIYVTENMTIFAKCIKYNVLFKINWLK